MNRRGVQGLSQWKRSRLGAEEGGPHRQSNKKKNFELEKETQNSKNCDRNKTTPAASIKLGGKKPKRSLGSQGA